MQANSDGDIELSFRGADGRFADDSRSRAGQCGFLSTDMFERGSAKHQHFQAFHKIFRC
jgi:hypothetical protein